LRLTSLLIWPQAALAADPLCYDAFEHLLRGQLVPPAEEAAVLASLAWRPGDEWVGRLYEVQLGSRQPGSPMAGRLDSLCASAVGQTGLQECSAAALRSNPDVVAACAEWSLSQGDAAGAYAATAALLARDPLCPAALPTHLSAAAALGKRNELFQRGHQLVGSDPTSGAAWFAVGCYYACAGQHASARRFLAKCTAVAPSFAPGWLAYGHAFAAAEESDQALAAYRTAARLFPGSPAPLLYMGVEYARGANWALARQLLASARDASPGDGRPIHELACVALRCGEHDEAVALFTQALSMAPRPLLACWEVRACVVQGPYYYLDKTFDALLTPLTATADAVGPGTRAAQAAAVDCSLRSLRAGPGPGAPQRVHPLRHGLHGAAGGRQRGGN
jgi:anaphase-promoting complex subunit 6